MSYEVEKEFLIVMLEKSKYERRAALFNFFFILCVGLFLTYMALQDDYWLLIPAVLMLGGAYLHLRTYQNAQYQESKVEAQLMMLDLEQSK